MRAAGVRGLPHLADKQVVGIEVSSKHLGRLAGQRQDLDAHFLPLPGNLHRLVVELDTSHATNVHKLKKGTNKGGDLIASMYFEHKREGGTERVWGWVGGRMDGLGRKEEGGGGGGCSAVLGADVIALKN